jgi:uncharacterized protein YjfI (DUF2170 family)
MADQWVVPEGGWDLANLTQLFASDPEALGDVDVDIDEGGEVLRITLKERGGLEVLMVASGEQVMCSAALVAASAIPNREAFERTLLSVHKLIPLSTFGIARIGGEEWYELFGGLSATSPADTLVEEVAVLAANAGRAAEWISEWITAGGDLQTMGELA